ncbi:uncharacterized protein LOC116306595 [Actinia tenebrosa]|uniref:Uncharacterized protein LOC116306595 n=1 Tax=Actinia tenebrosa TaxID=6105 RepID=A0A6P8IZB9_ACTTE|nr:uncharacterized protein LOC116306595 [Actinia tenebrosa]
METKPSKIILGFKLLFLLCQVSPVFGSCRNLGFMAIIKNKALTNHTIRSIQPITDARLCRAKCFLESQCFGINFCVDQDNTATCELTDSDHIRSERDLVNKTGCTFYGTEVRDISRI